MATAPTTDLGAAGSALAGIPGPRTARAGGEPEPPIPMLRLVRPLPGFAQLDRFALVRVGHAEDGGDVASATSETDSGAAELSGVPGLDPDGLIFELRSVQAPDVGFLVAAPGAFFPDYEVELDDSAVADLGLTDADDALILVILTVDADAASITANLLAPVVVNVRNRSAAQVILSGSDWPVRATVA